MITKEQLFELGFEQPEYFNGDFCKGEHTITLIDGKIDFIRERNNYHGLCVNINSIEELQQFLSFTV